MQLIVFLLVFYLNIINATSKSANLEKYGLIRHALYSKFVKCDHNKTLNLNVNQTRVYYYDFVSDTVKMYPISDAARGILKDPDLDKNRKFILFVPGYTCNILTKTEDSVRNAFNKSSDIYLLIIDHYEYTNDNDGCLVTYGRSVQHVFYIGKAIADMLIKLQIGGISPKSIHCIGYSLGAQMLGYTGDLFHKATKEKISRITALDPAGPCFCNDFTDKQVRSGVADYVEVYHCNAGLLGSSCVLGDTDFFVNRGYSQPNCGTPWFPLVYTSIKAAQCSHSACVAVYMSTVKNPNQFLALKCSSYRLFKDGKCFENDVTTPGLLNPGIARGVYYFNTTALSNLK